MFQFTREFIINDNKGKLSGGVRFGTDTNKDYLMIDRICNLKKDNIVNVFKTPGRASANEKITVTVPKLTANKVARLTLVLGQEGRVISTFNDYYPDHTKTFLYEITAKGTASTDAAAFKKAIDQELKLDGGMYFAVAQSGADIVFTMADEFTRVKEIKLVYVPQQSTVPVGHILTGYKDYDVVLDVIRKGASFEYKVGSTGITVTTAGDLGAGTAEYLIHNVRLQTASNITPYGINMDERPVTGAVYDQYLIEYVTERRHIGGQVFGAIDHSLASYVFFVNATPACDENSVSAAFAAILTELGLNVVSNTVNNTVGAKEEPIIFPKKEVTTTDTTESSDTTEP